MFKIISTGWNCKNYIDNCFESVDNQTLQDYKHIVIIDELPGDFPGIQVKLIDKKRKIYCNSFHDGKMKNFVSGIKLAKPNDEDIICDLDLDDYLLPEALETVAEVYSCWPDTLLTYGSYICVSGEENRFCGPYNSDDFRKQKWKASHFKTFKYKLFKRIKDRDFKDKSGRYVMACSDLAMMFPMLEIAGLSRIHWIKNPIYVYNDESPLNDHKRQKHEQERIEKYLRAKKRYNRW